MPDFLDILAKDAKKSVEEGYYDVAEETVGPRPSLRGAIRKCECNAIISEIKFASPSKGILPTRTPLKMIARQMEDGGAVGLSTLTEPRHFKGNPDFIVEIRHEVKIPILMKDIFVSFCQVDTASRVGASVILLIQRLFDRNYCEATPEKMISYAHSKGLEVLLEVHTEAEFFKASETNADLIGINNRNLETLEVDLGVTERILKKNRLAQKVIVSESGIKSPEDIRFLRDCGARGFLVGTSIMTAPDIEEKVKTLAMVN